RKQRYIAAEQPRKRAGGRRLAAVDDGLVGGFRIARGNEAGAAALEFRGQAPMDIAGESHGEMPVQAQDMAAVMVALGLGQVAPDDGKTGGGCIDDGLPLAAVPRLRDATFPPDIAEGVPQRTAGGRLAEDHAFMAPA